MGGLEDVGHDVLELGVDFFKGPGLHTGVLSHFELAGGHAARVGALAGPEGEPGLKEGFHRFGGGGHVGAFAYEDTAVLDEVGRVGAADFVLRGAREGELAGHVPHGMLIFGVFLRGDILGVFAELGVACEGRALDFLDLLEGVEVDAGGVVDTAARVAGGHGFGTELVQLFDGVDSHVAGAGHGAGGAFQIHVAGLEHVGGKVDAAVPGGFLAGQRAAPFEALAGEHAFKAGGQALVLAEHVADFAGSHADVSGGHVDGAADVAEGFRHEGLAETHDFGVGLALGIEVAAALGAADGEAAQAVLEDLFKTEEFQDAQVDAGVEAEAALVGAEGGVELDAVAAVHLHAALVVRPCHAEHDLAFGFDDAFENAVLLVLGVLQKKRFQRVEDFFQRLNELRLVGVALLHTADNFLHVARSHDVSSLAGTPPFLRGRELLF